MCMIVCLSSRLSVPEDNFPLVTFNMDSFIVLYCNSLNIFYMFFVCVCVCVCVCLCECMCMCVGILCHVHTIFPIKRFVVLH